MREDLIDSLIQQILDLGDAERQEFTYRIGRKMCPHCGDNTGTDIHCACQMED